MAKRLPKGKDIPVTSEWGNGEIVRYAKIKGQREYQIRLGPAHFVYLRRKDFRLACDIIPYKTLVRLREIEGH